MKAVMDKHIVAESDDIVEAHGYSYFPPMTNAIIGAEPAANFVENQLQLMRNLNTTPAVVGPSNVTDVKLFRVIIGGGDNRTAVRINGQ